MTEEEGKDLVREIRRRLIVDAEYDVLHSQLALFLGDGLVLVFEASQVVPLRNNKGRYKKAKHVIHVRGNKKR